MIDLKTIIAVDVLRVLIVIIKGNKYDVLGNI